MAALASSAMQTEEAPSRSMLSRVYLYVTAYPITLAITLAYRFWVRLTARCVFSYSDFDDTPY